MSERQYFIRGKPVTVDEIPGVVAVKLELPPEEELVEDVRRVVVEALGGEAPVSMSEAEREAFYEAGWVFVRRRPGPGAVRPPVRAAHVGPVFRHSSGRTLIGTDRLTVKLRPKLSSARARAALEEAGLSVVRRLRFAPNLYEARVPADRDFLDFAADLHHRSEFEYAEPEMIQHIGRRWWTPNDPGYDAQWQWRNLLKPGADVGAEIAWALTRGKGVRIAIIDNGFDVNHPDLAAAIGAGSGYFGEQGADTVFAAGPAGIPDDAHGTFCAGMAAAQADNEQGGCGIANEAELMLIACLEDQIGTQATLARAVGYAADPQREDPNANGQDGASVIACSLGPNDGNWELESALAEALDFAVTEGRGGLGTPVFWAVGNDAVSVDADPVCSHAAVIAVGRSTQQDAAGGSASGSALEFLAPGVGVYSTSANGGYGYDTGTSFATPCAAGIAALVLAVRPDLRWQDVRGIMRDTCDKIGNRSVSYGTDGRNDLYGYGRVNAGKAVVLAQASSSAVPPSAPPAGVTAPATLLI